MKDEGNAPEDLRSRTKRFALSIFRYGVALQSDPVHPLIAEANEWMSIFVSMVRKRKGVS